jgi:hypothetical protein
MNLAVPFLKPKFGVFVVALQIIVSSPYGKDSNFFGLADVSCVFEMG